MIIKEYLAHFLKKVRAIPLEVDSKSVASAAQDSAQLGPRLTPSFVLGEKIGAYYGYDASVKEQRPVSAQGQPLPWYTYPAIEYLSQWDCRGLNIFEYSSGYGSLWWADKGSNQYCVEHNPVWHAQISTFASQLKFLGLKENRQDYAGAIHGFNIPWDIIIIDGVWRVDCAAEALKAAGGDTIILLDNSDWYRDVAEILREGGYFQTDFSGFGPINNYASTTSLFFPFKSPLLKRIAMPVPICGTKTGKDPEFW